MSDYEIKPWTIKGVPPEYRNACREAAEKAKVSQGDWISQAIVAKVKADREGTGLPAVILTIPEGRPREDQTASRADQKVELLPTTLETLMRMAMTIAEAAGRPVPRSVTRPAHRIIQAQLEAMVPPKLPRARASRPTVVKRTRPPEDYAA